MKKMTGRILLAAFFCAAAVAASAMVVQYNARPITVKTPLIEGEVIERVELSQGELWFKDIGDLKVQLTQEDYLFVEGVSVTDRDSLVVYSDMNGGKKYSSEEKLEALNVYPEYWHIGGEPLKDIDKRLWVLTPCFIDGEPSRPVYMLNGARAHAVCYDYYTYYYKDINILIYAAPTPVKCSLDSILQYSPEVFGAGASSLRIRFGDMDSSIGDFPAAVYRSDDHFSAFFIVGETAYQVHASYCSQADFIELILSICNAPHPEKENYIDFLLK